jgi:hypothetical protein
MIRIVSAAVLTIGILLAGLCGPAGVSRQAAAVAASSAPFAAPIVVAEFPWQGHRG